METENPYLIDLEALRRDVWLAVGGTGPITPQTPCWKCGAIQPAHTCDPESYARRRLMAFAGDRKP